MSNISYLVVLFSSFFSLSGIAQTTTAKWVLPLQADWQPKHLANEMQYPLWKGTQVFAVVDTNGRIMPIATPIYSIKDSFIVFVEKKGLKGLSTLSGRILLPAVYEKITVLASWAFKVQKYGVNQIVNEENSPLLSYQELTHDYTYQLIHADQLALIDERNHANDQLLMRNGTRSPYQQPTLQPINNNSNSTKVKTKPDQIYLEKSKCFVQKEKTPWSYYLTKEDGSTIPIQDTIQQYVIDKSKTTFWAQKKEKWGLIQISDGTWAIPPIFSYPPSNAIDPLLLPLLTPFHLEPCPDNCLFQRYYINDDGKFIYPFAFSSVQDYDSKLWVTNHKDKKGLLASDGTIILDFLYDEVVVTATGWILVRKDKQWGLLYQQSKK